MNLIECLPIVRGEYRQNVNLAKFCWFGVGGNVSILYKPADIADLQHFMVNLPPDIPYFVFGAGSNLLVRDEGFEGVAIRLGREFNFINKLSPTQLKVGAACLDYSIAQIAHENLIGNLEFFAGIPGTFGGALAMNAGAYGTEIKDVLINARVITRSGQLKTYNCKEIGYSYRAKELNDGGIFVDGIIEGILSNHNTIGEKIQYIQNSRVLTQPIKSKTGGSTFKNPNGYKAWQLIDQAGCRGLSIGGAKVSELHCNFFINIGNSTANDLIQLIKEVKKRVFASSGIILQEEIKII